MRRHPARYGGQGMQMDLGLLDINEVAGRGSVERDKQRKRLRHTHADIRDAYEIARAAPLQRDKAPHPNGDLGVRHRLDH